MHQRGPVVSESSAALPPIDAHLEILLRLVDAQPEAALKICLTTPGGIVAGNLVGSRTWADRWEHVVSTATGAEDAADHMAHLAHTVRSALKEAESEPGTGTGCTTSSISSTSRSCPCPGPPPLRCGVADWAMSPAGLWGLLPTGRPREDRR